MERECTSLRLARIDLNNEVVSIEDISELVPRFLGGRGVNHYLLLQELEEGIGPMDPENVLLMGTGLLVGTQAPGANRVHVASLSPVTGGLGSSSAGGGFARELRLAGIDHLLITGKAHIPIYLYIADNRVEIRRADHLWGKNVIETEGLLRKEIGDENIGIACIGPAGENLDWVSSILFSGGRACGRCGLGAVLGAKNVKAIVARGAGKILVKGSDFGELVKAAIRKISNNDLAQTLGKFGTAFYVTVEGDPTRTQGVRNYQKAEPSKRLRMDDWEQWLAKDIYCPGCPVNCVQQYKVTHGKYAGTYVQKLEGDSSEDFASRLEIDNAAAVIKAHQLCQLYGLDVDNTSGVIGWAFECYQRGLLTKQDTDGLELVWGNEDAVMQLIEKIATRHGFGELLADGSKMAAQKLGKGNGYCMTIKGQELEEPMRPYKAWALGVVVSERGGGHTRGCPLTEFPYPGKGTAEPIWREELSQKLFGIPNPEDTTAYGNKAPIVLYYERLHALLDSLGVCFYMSNWIGPNFLSHEDLAALASSAMGEKISPNSIMQIGERIVVLGKCFNQIHGGFGRKDDYPPERLMCEPVDSGPFKGERLVESSWDKMLDEYYQIHDWDVKTGQITRTTLEQLGLGELRDRLSEQEV